MKIFSWVQNKLTSKKFNSIPDHNDHIQQPYKEEFNDWPQGLLAIGTFGNKMIKQELDQKANLQEDVPSEQDSLPLTPEEVGKLQKELNLMFHQHVEIPNLDPFDKLLEPNASSEAEERNSCNSACSNDHLQCSTSLVHSRGKDICLDNSKGAIGKKSLSFLLKKIFVCASGFSPAPSLRDPILESRMEKMLRTLLHKKIYPHSSSPKLSTKKSLESNIPKINSGGKKLDKKRDIDGSKWVRTDSEYIVLEI